MKRSRRSCSCSSHGNRLNLPRHTAYICPFSWRRRYEFKALWQSLAHSHLAVLKDACGVPESMQVTLAPLSFGVSFVGVPIDDGINPHNVHFGLRRFQFNQGIIVQVDSQVWRGITQDT